MKKPLRDGIVSVGGVQRDFEDRPVRLSTNFISDASQYSSVAFQESRPVRIGYIEVECSILILLGLQNVGYFGKTKYLSLEQRQKSTSNEGLPIKRGAKMMWAIPAGWDISQPDEFSECVLWLSVSPTHVIAIQCNRNIHHQDCTQPGNLPPVRYNFQDRQSAENTYRHVRYPQHLSRNTQSS
jgi:hypothetical protein